MHPSPSWKIRNLRPEDQPEFYAALDLFAHAFEDSENYLGQPPRADYVFELLSSPHFFLFVAQQGEEIVGALAGYELQKFEQMRREHYIYDIAVHQDHRRKGIATGLIERSREFAKSRGACALFVQADLVDEAAVALYAGLGERTDVAHFELLQEAQPLEA